MKFNENVEGYLNNTVDEINEIINKKEMNDYMVNEIKIIEKNEFNFIFIDDAEMLFPYPIKENHINTTINNIGLLVKINHIEKDGLEMVTGDSIYKINSFYPPCIDFSCEFESSTLYSGSNTNKSDESYDPLNRTFYVLPKNTNHCYIYEDVRLALTQINELDFDNYLKRRENGD